MKELQPQKVALAVGVFTGGFHLLWALLIVSGLAQPLLNFMYGVHMLNNPFIVAPFNIGTAVLLIVVTFIIGYAGGWAFALIWNKLHKG